MMTPAFTFVLVFMASPFGIGDCKGRAKLMRPRDELRASGNDGKETGRQNRPRQSGDRSQAQRLELTNPTVNYQR
jgi:hypothetical protein